MAESTYRDNTTAQELLAELLAVPEEHLDKEVVVHVALSDETLSRKGADVAAWWWSVQDGLHANVTAFEQFPATVDDPQPEPVSWHVYCREGGSVADEVSTMQVFGGFQAAMDEGAERAESEVPGGCPKCGHVAIRVEAQVDAGVYLNAAGEPKSAVVDKTSLRLTDGMRAECVDCGWTGHVNLARWRDTRQVRRVMDWELVD